MTAPELPPDAHVSDLPTAEANQACGAGRPRPRRRPPEEIAGALRELSAAAAARIARMPYRRYLARPRSERELRAYAEARGYKPGWVWHRLREQQAQDEEANA